MVEMIIALRRNAPFFFLYPTLDKQKNPERLRIRFLKTVYKKPTSYLNGNQS